MYKQFKAQYQKKKANKQLFGNLMKDWKAIFMKSVTAETFPLELHWCQLTYFCRYMLYKLSTDVHWAAEYL